MRTKKLTEVLQRIEAWPPEAQNALADFALDLDAGFKAGDYEPKAEELAGIDRALHDAAEGDASQLDAAIECDAQTDKLDRLAEQALAEHRTGRSREL